MPAERTIYDVKYYSVKRNTVTYCERCGNKIPIITPVYAKGHADSGEIFCRKCVIALSDRYQYEQYGRVPFPEAAQLYVGLIGHACLLLDDSTFITKTAIFRRGKKSAYLPVSYCTKCNRYFVDQSEYQKNREILSNYRLIHTITGKPIPGTRGWADGVDPLPEEKPEYSPAVVWAYQHPYQGGGCSGK